MKFEKTRVVGRPPLIPGKRMSERISVAFTVEEKEHLANWAAYKRMPLTTLVREAVGMAYEKEPGEEESEKKS